MAKKSLSVLAVLRELTDAAGRFVDRAPRQKRLESDRQAMLDAITRAQLILSVGGRKGDEPKAEEVTEAQALLKSEPGKDTPAQIRTLPKPPLREKRTRTRK